MEWRQERNNKLCLTFVFLQPPMWWISERF
jgi:hypothetical protein